MLFERKTTNNFQGKVGIVIHKYWGNLKKILLIKKFESPTEKSQFE